MSRLADLDRSIWHPFDVSNLEPIPVTSAKGSCLYTEDGRTIIDAISSWWVNIHGHAHPEISRAVQQQLEKLHHVLFAGFTHAPAVELAQKLLTKLPTSHTKLFFSDNGSTAVEVAIKLAIQFWKNTGVKRTRIIALENSYHGDTFGAMAAGSRSIFTEAFSDYFFDVDFLPPLDTHPDAAIKKLSSLSAAGDTAAFIFEPLIQGAGGMRVYAPEVLDTLLAIASEASVLTIADEVMTGFGRTGRWFATDYLTREPDLVCLSKGLSGGTLPLSITSTTQKVWDAFHTDEIKKTFFHGHSFTANPLACAAACASFDLLSLESTWKDIGRISNHHDAFVSILKQHPKIQNPRKLGTILACDVQSTSDKGYLNPIRDTVMKHCLERGVLIRPLGDVIYILPPYCITDKELLAVYDAVLSAVDLL